MVVPRDSLTVGSYSRRDLLKLGGAAAGAVALGPLLPRLVAAAPPANMYFERTWARTDKPVLDGNVSRTWMWGPEAFTGPLIEPYAESPDEERLVQYFDKARMEITNPGGDTNSIWYVTNGLLVVELITGYMQVGHNDFIQRFPANVNVAGDMDDPDGPTYATFGSLLNAAPLALNSTVTQRVNRQGTVSTDGSLAANGVTVGHIDDVTNHSIATPFWDFMNSSGTVYQNGGLTQDKLFENAYFATGRPISEPYWADVKVAGTQRLVLMQCFERRCLTYTPGNPPGWLVEAGNVGLHYYAWRYSDPVDPIDPVDPVDPVDPIDPGEFCVPAFEGRKPKASPATKLQRLLEADPVASTMTAAFFQMGRRYLDGHSPANDLEAAAFEAFAEMPESAQDILECSLGKLDDLSDETRSKLFNPMFPMDDSPVSEDLFANEMAIEIVQRASIWQFGRSQCMTEEHPGQMRATPGLDGVVIYTPTITKLNGLRTIQYGLAPEQYERLELEEHCTIVPVDTTGDGIPDQAQTNCPINPPPCTGHTNGSVCMRVPEVRAGQMIHLVGANYFSVEAKVLFSLNGSPVSEVAAHVCGDTETPVTETVNGVEHVIRDYRVNDQITFVVPNDIASGVYTIQVVIEHTINGNQVTEYGAYEYIRVVAPPTTTFKIHSEQLICVAETSPAFLGSDEVGLRIVTVPINLDGSMGEPLDHKFGGGSLGIFEDVDSGETRDITREIFSRNNIAGVAMAVIGFEVDSESAYRDQVQGFIDAFIHVMKSSIYKVVNTIVSAVGALVGVILGLSKALVTAIAALVVAAILVFTALWAPADLIMQDFVGLSAIDLDEMTSPNYQARSVESYTTPGDIKVTVEPISKIVDYREQRGYVSDEEDSHYQILLRYSRS